MNYVNGGHYPWLTPFSLPYHPTIPSIACLALQKPLKRWICKRSLFKTLAIP